MCATTAIIQSGDQVTIELRASNINKTFLLRKVLKDVNLHARSGDVLGVVGDNGTGKSTLVRILAGVLREDSGTCALTVNGAEISSLERPLHVGFVAPYLRLYDEFTPRELLDLHTQLQGASANAANTHAVLDRIGLAERADDVIATLSSGLRQRVALALAVHRDAPLLILDEPSITLDASGRAIVEAELQRHIARGGIAILATNDEREKELCTTFCEL